jgi:putative redox protein
VSTTAPATLPEILEAFRADPGRAARTLRVGSELTHGVRCEAPIRQHRMVIDEPLTLGGTDEGASPVELALAALGTCQAITYRVWAAQLGIALERVRVEAEGDIDLRGFYGLDEESRAGFGAVRLRVILEGPEPPERYRELAEAVDRHCPVLDLVQNPVSIVRTLSLPDASSERARA